MRLSDRDEQSFDPAVVASWLAAAGAIDQEPGDVEIPQDETLKLLEKFLRAFLRSTHIDESFIRLRMGKIHSPVFFDDVLPLLLEHGVLEEVQWKGQGVQHRYKLASPMTEVSTAIEESGGTFSGFLDRFVAQSR